MIRLKKHIWKAMGIILLAFFYVGLSYAARTAAAPILDLSDFTQKQRELISRQIQEQKDKIKEIDNRSLSSAQPESADTAKTEQASGAIEQKTQVPVAETPSKEKDICDCDDPDDAYNYPSNFLYDSNQEKVSRIKPPCQCEAHDSSASTPIAVAPVTEKKSPKDNSKTIQWNIQY